MWLQLKCTDTNDLILLSLLVQLQIFIITIKTIKEYNNNNNNKILILKREFFTFFFCVIFIHTLTLSCSFLNIYKQTYTHSHCMHCNTFNVNYSFEIILEEIQKQKWTFNELNSEFSFKMFIHQHSSSLSLSLSFHFLLSLSLSFLSLNLNLFVCECWIFYRIFFLRNKIC